jgi:SNF2-related domain/Helicase conserved C-terminal domain/PLD-like domain
MKRRDAAQLGLGLDASGRPWPPQERFPHNFGTQTVGERVVQDLLDSPSPLLITGYAGIEQLLDLFRRYRTSGGRPAPGARLLVGVEPTPRRIAPTPAVSTSFDDEIADYWLGRGVSLLNASTLLATLELIEADGLTVRSSTGTRVHAKMYVGDRAVTLGSSNFTRPGLEGNLEANARFERAREAERYEEAVRLAENLWDLGTDYTEGFKELLEQLLRKVTWPEALARACAELLEGDWTPSPRGDDEERATLWPSQEHGIGQALWVLENHGAVLVADATGSGKTRMGAHLLRALQDRNWRMGRARMRFPMVICPAAVRQLWSEELADAAEAVSVFSQGVLSVRTSGRHEEVTKALRHTRILAVDEAHNFLNRLSQRSRMIYGNVADNVILLTATPINRGAQDLLAIVELLGADNFEEDVLQVVGRLARRGGSKGGPIRDAERDKLRTALQEFVVRRTKAEFNRLVDREPGRYINALGQRCRYPEHMPVVYAREDPPGDCQRALAIREKAKSLRGVINFRRTLKMPHFLRVEGWTEERFLTMRLKGASALAGYQVRSRLRSSKVALVEHILGTAEAHRLFGIQGIKARGSGNILATLERIAGKPPPSALDVELPSWLREPSEHRRVAEEEIEIYRDIQRQTEQMSDHRMDANAEYLLGLLEEHPRVLAFDSHLISLYDLKQRLTVLGAGDVVLATGEGGMKARRAFSKWFSLSATEGGVIGLCSDALAEGLNLQGASAVIHLDLPSVIRVLEQRIGRVDRMDSPHAQIAVHWPEEPRAFQLRSDERLFGRLREVEDLLGSNVPIPAEFETYEAERGDYVDVREIIAAVDKEEAPDTAITLADAFSRVRGMVSGPEALVSDGVYQAIRASQAQVLSSVAVVPSRGNPWVFLAIGASDRSVPRWVLVEENGVARVTGTLDTVAEAVRARLAPGPADVPFDEDAGRVLGAALQAAEAHRPALLSRRKQRALEEMEYVLRRYDKAADKAGDRRRGSVIRQILETLETSSSHFSVDLDQIADWWLRLIRPEWYGYLSRKRVRRPARLRHLRSTLRDQPISTQRLETLRDVEYRTESLDRRVVAAIVGVSSGSAPASSGGR